jgi:hypothetical protein
MPPFRCARQPSTLPTIILDAAYEARIQTVRDVGYRFTPGQANVD